MSWLCVVLNHVLLSLPSVVCVLHHTTPPRHWTTFVQTRPAPTKSIYAQRTLVSITIHFHWSASAKAKICTWQSWTRILASRIPVGTDHAPLSLQTGPRFLFQQESRSKAWKRAQLRFSWKQAYCRPRALRRRANSCAFHGFVLATKEGHGHKSCAKKIATTMQKVERHSARRPSSTQC